MVRYPASSLLLQQLTFALVQNDMVEYNQCQATLKSLYDLGITGGHEAEFTAYRILMLIHGRNRSGQ
jgi:SAC3 family protein LENG8/THP3